MIFLPAVMAAVRVVSFINRNSVVADVTGTSDSSPEASARLNAAALRTIPAAILSGFDAVPIAAITEVPPTPSVSIEQSGEIGRNPTGSSNKRIKSFTTSVLITV